MVTAQDIFPKVGNDPMYYSEANRFARGCYNIKTGSLTTALGSQTGTTVCGLANVTIAGSYLVAGSLYNPSELMIDFYGIKSSGTDYFIGISGINTYAYVSVGSMQNDPNINYGNFKALVGSPLGACMFASAQNINIDNQKDVAFNRSNSATTITNLNIGSPFVIFLGFTEVFSTAYYGSFSIQAFGGAYA